MHRSAKLSDTQPFQEPPSIAEKVINHHNKQIDDSLDAAEFIISDPMRFARILNKVGPEEIASVLKGMTISKADIDNAKSPDYSKMDVFQQVIIKTLRANTHGEDGPTDTEIAILASEVAIALVSEAPGALSQSASRVSRIHPEILSQMQRRGLPQAGEMPFIPRTFRDRSGRLRIQRGSPERGPRSGTRDQGFVAQDGNVWMKHIDQQHGDHWDVQIDNGQDHINVNPDGSINH